jgi:hypothetical protein
MRSSLPFSISDVYSSYTNNNPTTNVVPIVADRISLPVQAGSVPLLDVLPPDVSRVYSNPSVDSSLFRPQSERPAVPPPRLSGHQTEWVKLVRRMVQCEMVDFTISPKVVCGVFAVPKDKDTDRLIIDINARPTNAIFVEPKPVKLPTPDLLSRMEMCKSVPTFTAKVDLDNFYHRLRLPNWMRCVIILHCRQCERVILVVISKLGLGRRQWYIRVVSLYRFSHSVLLSQLAYEYILDTRTSLRGADRITATTTDGRVDRVRHQVYIDDLILFGTDENMVRAKQLEYIEAVESVGLVVKRSKVLVWW